MLSRVAIATGFTLDDTDYCQFIMEKGSKQRVEVIKMFHVKHRFDYRTLLTPLIIFLFELCESLYLFLVVLSLHKQIRLFSPFGKRRKKELYDSINFIIDINFIFPVTSQCRERDWGNCTNRTGYGD